MCFKLIVILFSRCWLSIEKGLIWAFVAPVLGVVLVRTQLTRAL
jgi:hypothetical protein